MASLRLGACRLQLDQPDVAGAAEATSTAVELAAHNRSRRVVNELRRNRQALEPWRNVPEVANVYDRMAAYGIA